MAGADPQGGPGGVLGQQSFQINQIFHRGCRAAGGAQNELVVGRAAENSLFDVIFRIVVHPGVKDFNLRFHTVFGHCFAQFLQKLRGIEKQARMHPVHGPGIKRGQIRFQLDQVRHPGFVRRMQIARSCEVQDDVAFFPNEADGFTEFLLIHGPLAFVIPHMEMSNTGARLPAFVNIVSNFPWS